MIERETLLCEAQTVGVTLNAAQLTTFERYAKLLLEWNEKFNLTAITTPAEIVTRHFVDSLALLGAYSPPSNATLVDVGAGAGFPSVPVKIVRADLRLTLLDSLGKRVGFLEALSQALTQKNNCVHMRAEEAGQKPEYREQFDLATARAVAHLRELSEYCLPLLKVGGVFAALKGGDVAQELAEAEKAIALMGGRLREKKQFALPDGSGRTILIIEKISHSSTKYPRPHAKIAKCPLA